MKLIATKAFAWAHRGCIVEQFERDAVIETEDEDLIRVSLEEGWTRDAEAEAKAKAGAKTKTETEADAKAKAEGEAK